jgi:hypothetical protein
MYDIYAPLSPIFTSAKVGNLSFFSTEEQIYEVFVKCTRPEEGGGIRRIIMGLDSQQKLSSATQAHFALTYLV